MDGLVRLQQLWSWLPAFRAVAEAEHLPTAAQRLGVSAPALSRTIRLLEGQLDAALFVRAHGRLRLNDAGRALLDSLRDAMRLVDDGWDRAVSVEHEGFVRLGVATGAVGELLVGAVSDVAAAHPAIVPVISRAHVDALPEQLVGGALDLALLERHLNDPRLRVERVARIPVHVYCARGSLLARSPRVSRETLLAQPFVAPPPSTFDGWPADVPRRIALECDSLALAVELCARGPWVAALPSTVEGQTAGAGLQRIATSVELAPIDLYLASRRPVAARRAGSSTPTKIELLGDALRAAARTVPSL